MIHSANPKSRPVVIIVFTQSCCPSVHPTFLKSSKTKHSFSENIFVLRHYEGIMDDCLVDNIFVHNFRLESTAQFKMLKLRSGFTPCVVKNGRRAWKKKDNQKTMSTSKEIEKLPPMKNISRTLSQIVPNIRTVMKKIRHCCSS